MNEPLDTLMKRARGSNVVMHAATRNNVRVLFSSTSEVYGKQSRRLLSAVTLSSLTTRQMTVPPEGLAGYAGP